jgi:hypothetical protein
MKRRKRMKRSEVIDMLSVGNPDDEVLIMWWEYELAKNWSTGEALTVDEWNDIVCELGDLENESANVGDLLQDLIHQAEEERVNS